nr:MAG TPA_asm: hypothetical protein [Caudoviricetes sp.]
MQAVCGLPSFIACGTWAKGPLLSFGRCRYCLGKLKSGAWIAHLLAPKN